MISRRRRLGWILTTLAALAVAAAFAVAGVLGGRTTTPAGPKGADFPVIDRTALSDARLRVIDTTKAHFDAQRPGLAYSDGVEEPWCADFVSAVMQEAGHPMINPNSGHWRIPGVYTLQEYYQSVGRFEQPGYQPQPGDIVLYGEGSALGLHTNIVVAVASSTDSGTVQLTTVGGNEDGRIRVRTIDIGPDSQLLGYGRLT